MIQGCFLMRIPNEALMHIPALAILTVTTVLTAAPARSQTYGPDYPVCLLLYDQQGCIHCDYTSLAQCEQSASGRAAQCLINPNFARARVPAGRHYRRVY